MGDDCKTVLKNLSKNLHNSCIYSNLFFFLAGIYGLYISSKIPDCCRTFVIITSISYLLVGIFSSLHHVHPSKKELVVLDYGITITASISTLLLISYCFIKNKINSCILTFALILIIFAYGLYTLSIKHPTHDSESDDVINNMNPIDNQRQIMRYVYHSVWHMLMGISATVIMFSIIV